MARWKKLLARMLRDSNPTSYTYEEAAGILRRLNFELAPVGGTSHRKWRFADSTRNLTVYVGLIDKGHGTLKAYLVTDMVTQLKDNGLVPADLRDEDGEQEMEASDDVDH